MSSMMVNALTGYGERIVVSPEYLKNPVVHDGRCLLDPEIADLSVLAKHLRANQSIDVIFLNTDTEGPNELFEKLRKFNPDICPPLKWACIDDENRGLREDLVLGNSTSTPVVVYRYCSRYRTALN